MGYFSGFSYIESSEDFMILMLNFNKKTKLASLIDK